MNHPSGSPNLVSIPSNQLFPAVEDILKDGTQFKLVVTGDSMRPFLHHRRDSVILSGPNIASLRCGDIVLIRRDDDKYALHRVRRLLPDGFIMNGDAQTRTEHIRYNQVIAVVSKIIRNSKLISCDNRLYRFLCELWMLLWPVRGIFIRCSGLLKRMCKAVIAGGRDKDLEQKNDRQA